MRVRQEIQGQAGTYHGFLDCRFDLRTVFSKLGKLQLQTLLQVLTRMLDLLEVQDIFKLFNEVFFQAKTFAVAEKGLGTTWPRKENTATETCRPARSYTKCSLKVHAYLRKEAAPVFTPQVNQLQGFLAKFVAKRAWPWQRVACPYPRCQFQELVKVEQESLPEDFAS